MTPWRNSPVLFISLYFISPTIWLPKNYTVVWTIILNNLSMSSWRDEAWKNFIIHKSSLTIWPTTDCYLYWNESELPIDGRAEVTCPGDTNAIYRGDLESVCAGADPGFLAGPQLFLLKFFSLKLFDSIFISVCVSWPATDLSPYLGW